MAGMLARGARAGGSKMALVAPRGRWEQQQQAGAPRRAAARARGGRSRKRKGAHARVGTFYQRMHEAEHARGGGDGSAAPLTPSDYETYRVFDALLGAQGAGAARFREGVERLRERLAAEGEADAAAVAGEAGAPGAGGGAAMPGGAVVGGGGGGFRPWYIEGSEEEILAGLKNAGGEGFELPSDDQLRAAQALLDAQLAASPDAQRLAQARREVMTLVRAGLLPDTCLDVSRDSPFADRGAREEHVEREFARRRFDSKRREVMGRNANRKAVAELYAQMGLDAGSKGADGARDRAASSDAAGMARERERARAQADTGAALETFARKRAEMLERRRVQREKDNPN